MKFKIGDKVKHKDFGIGEIIGFDESDNSYAVEFEYEYKDCLMHNFSTTYMYAGLTKPIDRNAGYWCLDDEIELVEEAPKNLIPQIAKMLGVDIGEEFYLRKNLENDTNMRIYKFVEDGLKLNTDHGWQHSVLLDVLLVGKYTIQKLPKKPHLTEDEKAILRNLPKQYKWIARDRDNKIWVFELKPHKQDNSWMFENVSSMFDRIVFFEHLFQFIKWEDNEPYKIQELLEEDKNLMGE